MCSTKTTPIFAKVSHKYKRTHKFIFYKISFRRHPLSMSTRLNLVCKYFVLPFSFLVGLVKRCRDM